jgi:hypothetical protein
MPGRNIAQAKACVEAFYEALYEKSRFGSNPPVEQRGEHLIAKIPPRSELVDWCLRDGRRLGEAVSRLANSAKKKNRGLNSGEISILRNLMDCMKDAGLLRKIEGTSTKSACSFKIEFSGGAISSATEHAKRMFDGLRKAPDTSATTSEQEPLRQEGRPVSIHLPNKANLYQVVRNIVPPPTQNTELNTLRVDLRVRVVLPTRTPDGEKPLDDRGGVTYTRHETTSSDFVTELLEGKFGNRVVLLGETGAGKSCLLRAVAEGLSALDADDAYPIVVPLREIEWTHPRALEHYLCETWIRRFDDPIATSEREERRRRIKDFVSRERTWLLLDGIDEMRVSPALRVRSLLTASSDWGPNVRVLATCRTSVWQRGAGHDGTDAYTRVELQPFDVTQQRKMLDSALGTQQAEVIWGRLRTGDHAALQEITQNPLDMVTLCDVVQNGAGRDALPASHARLYRAFVEAGWRREDQRRGDDERLDATLDALAVLASQACFNADARNVLRCDNVQRVFEGTPGASRERAEAAGWLRATPCGLGYEFPNARLQAYFASRAVRDWRQDLFSPEGENPVLSALTHEGGAVARMWAGACGDADFRSAFEMAEALLRFGEGRRNYVEFQAFCLGTTMLTEIPAGQQANQTARQRECVRTLWNWCDDRDYGQEATRALQALRPSALAAPLRNDVQALLDSRDEILATVSEVLRSEDLRDGGAEVQAVLDGLSERLSVLLAEVEDPLFVQLNRWAGLASLSIDASRFLASLPEAVRGSGERVSAAAAALVPRVKKDDAALALQEIESLEKSTEAFHMRIELARFRLAGDSLPDDLALRLADWVKTACNSGAGDKLTRVLEDLEGTGPSLPALVVNALWEHVEDDILTCRRDTRDATFRTVSNFFLKSGVDLSSLGEVLQETLESPEAVANIEVGLRLAQLLAVASPGNERAKLEFSNALSSAPTARARSLFAIYWLTAVHEAPEPFDQIRMVLDPRVAPDRQLYLDVLSRLTPTMLSPGQAKVIADLTLRGLVAFLREEMDGVLLELRAVAPDEEFSADDRLETLFLACDHLEFGVSLALPFAERACAAGIPPTEAIRQLWELGSGENAAVKSLYRFSESTGDTLGRRVARNASAAFFGVFKRPVLALRAARLLEPDWGDGLLRPEVLTFVQCIVGGRYHHYDGNRSRMVAEVADWAAEALPRDREVALHFAERAAQPRCPVAVQRYLCEALGPAEALRLMHPETDDI